MHAQSDYTMPWHETEALFQSTLRAARDAGADAGDESAKDVQVVDLGEAGRQETWQSGSYRRISKTIAKHGGTYSGSASSCMYTYMGASVHTYIRTSTCACFGYCWAGQPHSRLTRSRDGCGGPFIFWLQRVFEARGRAFQTASGAAGRRARRATVHCADPDPTRRCSFFFFFCQGPGPASMRSSPGVPGPASYTQD